MGVHGVLHRPKGFGLAGVLLPDTSLFCAYIFKAGGGTCISFYLRRIQAGVSRKSGVPVPVRLGAEALNLFKDLPAEGTLPTCGLRPSVQTHLLRKPLRN
jgi:hypothetical protein